MRAEKINIYCCRKSCSLAILIHCHLQEKTETGRDIALAQAESAREQLRQAGAALATQKALLQMEATLQGHAPVIRQREEARKAEELKMSDTKIHAPADGYVTKRAVETGEQIQAGQALMAVVPLADVWVVANCKETQLERVKPGQKVRISVDTYPEKTFEGTVESIMAGTGSVFSLFLPENATGNYVKVVQRIPIKIVLKQGTDPEHLLRVGMSVIPPISNTENMAKNPNKWIVALTVMLPVLMVILDTSIVNVSLDHIRGSLSAGIDESTWAITSYLAANAVAKY